MISHRGWNVEAQVRLGSAHSRARPGGGSEAHAQVARTSARRRRDRRRLGLGTRRAAVPTAG
ncbi:hypothetical protein [Pseudenhygromyxa sp. WMMC2535]|uniref:hypothetical protein n=1 Tax=Pseudenhygromyxa sp. WMMC2535 TaxID=2712867 RepID=UPI001C3CDEA8|nr:hypothetical protein [Pseudenhygromyxa sp. WMMC2535]